MSDTRSSGGRDVVPAWDEFYRDLHRHPELSFQEHRTAGIVADRLRALGLQVAGGVGGTGVVGVLRNGAGPTVLLRADMDALPVQEDTGLPYASTARGADPDGRDVPLMHACGHDMHVTCLLAAITELAADRGGWSGTVMAVFQPAEEVGAGARAMVDDGLFDRFGVPDVVLGQHVGPFAAGMVAVHSGPAFAAADALRIVMYGKGGHGSRPEATVDPIVMAAATVLRLQTVVSREVAGTEMAVLTIGSLHAGAKDNVIPEQAELGLSFRTFDPHVRDRVLAAITRIVRAEASASGAPRDPDIVPIQSFPAVVNDEAATDRVRAAFTARFGGQRVMDPGVVTGSEDVGVLATAAGAPCMFWLLGGTDPATFAAAYAAGTTARDIPSNHSPAFAPLIQPTLDTGVAALVTAATTWMPAL